MKAQAALCVTSISHPKEITCRLSTKPNKYEPPYRNSRTLHGRDFDMLEAFMQLFVDDEGIEMIGIGAAGRGGDEWFQGPEQVRDIVEGDWKYWGDVVLDVDRAKITVAGEVAWLSTQGRIVQTTTHDEALPFYMEQMQTLLKDESLDHDARLMEATHFGIRRLRERAKGQGHGWPFTFTAILQWVDGRWRFHTIHWAMPVD